MLNAFDASLKFVGDNVLSRLIAVLTRAGGFKTREARLDVVEVILHVPAKIAYLVSEPRQVLQDNIVGRIGHSLRSWRYEPSVAWLAPTTRSNGAMTMFAE
jgi:hypothetical protein